MHNNLTQTKKKQTHSFKLMHTFEMIIIVRYILVLPGTSQLRPEFKMCFWIVCRYLKSHKTHHRTVKILIENFLVLLINFFHSKMFYNLEIAISIFVKRVHVCVSSSLFNIHLYASNLNTGYLILIYLFSNQ